MDERRKNPNDIELKIDPPGEEMGNNMPISSNPQPFSQPNKLFSNKGIEKFLT